MSRRYAFILGLWLLGSAGPAAAQRSSDETFAVTPLQHLLAGEHEAVVRLAEDRFDVIGPGRATETVRRVVTILGAGARDEGRVVVFYNKLRQLKKLTGQLRDASGRVVRKLKNTDEEDYSAISGYSLYEDARVRVASLYHDTYPYTVEFAYELDHDGLVNWPTWYPQEYEAAVERASFEIEAPAAMAVRHTVRGTDLEPVVTHAGARQTLRWTVEALPAFEDEPYGPAIGEQLAAVHTAPERFEVEGTGGSMATWADVGRWYHSLTAGRQNLPPEAVAQVRALVEDAPDAREKARRLYRFLQERSRYVSIQLGLGGWQPFDALYVHQRGYGDCKALTNYMLALLQVAGIEAYPALIRRGLDQPEVLPDFPNARFNHAVLFVPLEGDTLWLENTSQTIPFGHLGADNEDRYALVARPDGGELVRTPRSRPEENLQVRQARVVLAPDGNATADVETAYAGNQQDYVRLELTQASARDREEWLHNTLGLPSFEVVRADFASLDAREREIRLPVSLRLPRYGSRTGSRLFFRPCLMGAWTDVPPAAEDRRQPVEVYPYAFVDVDTVSYVLPAGFSIEALPAPVTLEAPFGRYEASLEPCEDGTLAYRRRLEVHRTELPPEEYGAFRDFFRQVAQADRVQAVLVAQ